MEDINLGNQSQQNSNESPQNSTNNPLVISNADIERVLQVKCKRHPKKNAEFLLIMPDVQNLRICHSCAREDKIPYENYLEIKEVLSESNESNLFSILTPTDPQLSDEIQNLSKSIDSQKDRIDSFFKEIKNQIEVKLEERKQAQKLKLIQLDDIYQSSVICKSKINMDCKNLQSILLQKDNEQKLAEFIRNHISNSQITTQRIKEACTQFQVIQNEFSMDKPNRIRNLASQLLEEINFFEGTHPSPLLAIEQSDDRDALQRKIQELEESKRETRKTQETLLQRELLIQQLLEQQEQLIVEISALKTELSVLQQSIKVSLFFDFMTFSLIFVILLLGNKDNKLIGGQLDSQKKSLQPQIPQPIIKEVNKQQLTNELSKFVSNLEIEIKG